MNTNARATNFVYNSPNWDLTITPGLPTTLADNTTLVFNPNPYYDGQFAGDEDYLEDKFVRFSYRFKFEDNQYSLFAPFTQIAFIPKQDGYFLYVKNDAQNFPETTDQSNTYRSTVVSFMENKADIVKLRIPLPFSKSDLQGKLNISDIDILYKESNGLAVKVIDTISIADIVAQTAEPNVFTYDYISKKPYKTLPEDELTRVYDKIPVRAFSQEIASNRSIELYKISSDLNPTEYETTMYDVVSKFYPDGGLGTLNVDVNSGDTTMQILKANFQGDLIPGATIAFINTTSPGTFTTTTLTVSSVSSSSTYWTVGTSAGLPVLAKANTEVVFNYNYYYDITYNGDENLLKDKFIRFAYRFKYVDGEYSIISPFTQECFIPKQDGYFMYKRNPIPSFTPPNFGTLVAESPPLEIQDEEDTFRTTTVDFMENKVNKILLRIPLPQTSNLLEQDFKISELDVLYKESTSSNIRVVETIPVARIRQGEGRGAVNGAINASTTVVIDDVSGSIKPGMLIEGTGITNNPRVVSFNGTNQVVMSSAQTIADNVDLVLAKELILNMSISLQNLIKFYHQVKQLEHTTKYL